MPLKALRPHLPALLILLLTIGMHLMPTMHSTIFSTELFNALHLAGFAALGLYLFTHLSARTHFFKSNTSATAVLSLLLCAGAGLLMEWLQSFSASRQPSLHDVALDTLGAASALSLLVLRRQRRPLKRMVAAVLALGVVVLTARVFAPSATILGLWLERRFAAPVLCDFDHYFPDALIAARDGATLSIVAPPSRWSTNHSRAVGQLDFCTSAWPRFAFADIYPDWRSGHSFAIDLFNPTPESLPLKLHLNDRPPNGTPPASFDTIFSLPPGPYTLSVTLQTILNPSKGRQLDVRSMHFLSISPLTPAPATLYLDNIRLITKQP